MRRYNISKIVSYLSFPRDILETQVCKGQWLMDTELKSRG